MYPRILERVYAEPWCITVPAHHAIQNVLEAHMARRIEMPANPAMAGFMSIPPMNAAGLGLTVPRERGSRLYTRGKLGVIPVRGVIGHHLSSLEMLCGGYGVEQLQYDLELASEDSSIERLLVDFHSPGGTITQVPESARMLRKIGLSKETFGITTGESASASYWLMSQVQNLYLTESAMVGSIGVYLALLDRSDEMKQKGIKLKLIKAGEHKGMGLPGNPLTDDQEAMLQAMVNDTYKAFTGSIRAARPQVKDEVMQGQMFRGQKAVNAGLADATVTSLASLVRRLS